MEEGSKWKNFSFVGLPNGGKGLEETLDVSLECWWICTCVNEYCTNEELEGYTLHF